MVKIKTPKILLFFVFFLISSVAFASDKIVSIEFRGLVRGSAESLKSTLKSQVGRAYDASLVRKDIKTLFETGLFSDVSAQKEAGSGGVRLVFVVQENGLVGSIRFEGNKKIKTKDLKQALIIREDNPLDLGKISETEAAIEKLYKDKDYTVTEISHEILPLDSETNEMEIVFHIQENKEAKIKRITFVGNKVFSDRKLAGEIRTKVKGMMSFISGSGKLNEDKLKVDTDMLMLYYLNHGYLKVKIGKPQITLTRDKKSLYITFPLYEGDQYKIGKVDVTGDILTTPEEIKSKFKLKTGMTYSRSTQDEDSQMLDRAYGDQAYAFANIYPSIETDDAAKTADIIYYIQKGPKIVIERIDITGNNITHDKVIRRELQIAENAPYNETNLQLSKRRLMQLGYFSEVNFSTPRGSRDDRVVLVIQVKEKPTGTFNIGAGFSTLESIVFNASIQKDNFFGLGLQGGVYANLSKLRQEFSLSVTDRYFLDTRWIASFSVHRYFSQLNNDFDQKSFGGEVTFGRELFQFVSLSAGYNIEDVSVTNFSSQVPLFFQNNSSGLTSSIVTTLAYDTRDNRITSQKGMYHFLRTQYAGNGLAGDNDFFKAMAESRFFLRMPLKTLVKFRGQFSYVRSLNGDIVPLFERFFLGGINTLRGFDLNTIGPEIRIPSSATGGDGTFTYGGDRQLLFNLEYEIPIYDPAGIRFVLFADAGQAFAETEDIDILKLRANYGFGLRWNSPFGPLRFEWGFPINRHSGESFTVFNFTIGQSF